MSTTYIALIHAVAHNAAFDQFVRSHRQRALLPCGTGDAADTIDFRDARTP